MFIEHRCKNIDKVADEQRKGLENKFSSLCFAKSALPTAPSWAVIVYQVESAVLSALCFAKLALPTASIFAVH